MYLLIELSKVFSNTFETGELAEWIKHKCENWRPPVIPTIGSKDKGSVEQANNLDYPESVSHGYNRETMTQ